MENQQNNLSDVILDDFRKPSIGKLYKINHIRNATFFGGPLVGAYLIAENFKAMGEDQYVTRTWIYGFVGLAGAIILSLVLSMLGNITGLISGLANAYIASYYTTEFQGEVIENHEQNNGLMHDSGKVIGIVVAGLVLNIALVFGVVILVFG